MKPSSPGLVLAAVTLGFAVIQLDVSVVNVAVKAIGAGLGDGITGVQWVVDAYTLTFAALIISMGALGDRIGARRVLLGGFVLFVLTSAACGAAPSIGVLVTARLVQGIAAAALGACSLALLNHTFPEQAARTRAVGIWALGGSAALAAGPLAGGVLIASLGWRSIFFINVPVGAAGCWLTARYAAETPRARDRGVDLPGQAAAVLALAALAGATITAGQRGFGSADVIAGYVVAIVAGTVFVLLEGRQVRPMVPLSMFRSRTFSVTAGAGLVVNIVFYGLIFAFSLYLQRQQRLPALAAGLAFLPVMIAIMASNSLAGRVIRWLGTRWTMVGGALIMVTGCAAELAALSVPVPVPVSVLALAVCGLGIGVIVPAMTSALLGGVDRTFSGVASGTFTALRQTGSVLGVALFGSLLAGRGAVSGLHLACVLSVPLALLVAGLSLGVPRPAEIR
jgi:MFS transporter, DHA2 family, methylenomycin A resistance protein